MMRALYLLGAVLTPVPGAVLAALIWLWRTR